MSQKNKEIVKSKRRKPIKINQIFEDVNNGLSIELLKKELKYRKEIEVIIKDAFGYLAVQLEEGKIKTDYSLKRAKEMFAFFSASMDKIPTSFILDEIADYIPKYMKKRINQEVGFKLLTSTPSKAQLIELAKNTIFDKKAWGGWWKDHAETTKNSVKLLLRRSIAIGKTNAKLGRELRDGLKEELRLVPDSLKNQKPENEKQLKQLLRKMQRTATRNATAIARTGIQEVANGVRLEMLNTNAKIFQGVRYVATLDTRTTKTCMTLDGKIWTLPDHKPYKHNKQWVFGSKKSGAIGNIVHWNCRSSFIPHAFDVGKLEGDTRYSMDGIIEDQSFEDWFRNQTHDRQNQLVGVKRADLLREGKISFNDLTKTNSEARTLKELKALQKS